MPPVATLGSAGTLVYFSLLLVLLLATDEALRLPLGQRLLPLLLLGQRLGSQLGGLGLSGGLRVRWLSSGPTLTARGRADERLKFGIVRSRSRRSGDHFGQKRVKVVGE